MTPKELPLPTAIATSFPGSLSYPSLRERRVGENPASEEHACKTSAHA